MYEPRPEKCARWCDPDRGSAGLVFDIVLLLARMCSFTL